MAAKPCPSCKKNNCGNHAACARRKAAECPWCRRSPCPDKKHCEAMHYLWDVVAHVERVVHYVIKSNGLIPYDQLDSETLSALR